MITLMILTQWSFYCQYNLISFNKSVGYCTFLNFRISLLAVKRVDKAAFFAAVHIAGFETVVPIAPGLSACNNTFFVSTPNSNNNFTFGLLLYSLEKGGFLRRVLLKNILPLPAAGHSEPSPEPIPLPLPVPIRSAAAAFIIAFAPLKISNVYQP